jgi:hypothetical protein
MQGDVAFGDLVFVYEFAGEEEAVGAADVEESVAQSEREVVEGVGLVGIAVEQRVGV